MTKRLIYHTGIWALIVGLSACSSSGDELAPGDVSLREGGTLTLQLNTDNAFGKATRALEESRWSDAGNYTVTINSAAGKTWFTGTLADFTDGEYEKQPIPNGSYTITASYGTESPASQMSFLSTGSAAFNIENGESKAVSVSCEPTCGKLIVEFASDMDAYFSNYYVDIETPATSSRAVHEKGNTAPWYLLADASGTKVTATIHLTPKSEYQVNGGETVGTAQDGTVVKTFTLSRNKSVTLSVAPNYVTSYGSLGIKVSINDAVDNKEVTIEVPSEWL